MEKSNIDEKIKLLTGSGMWHTQEVEGLPSVHLSDGPHGLRKQEEKERQNNVSLVSTCYPTASALACSWDVTAAERLGRAVAKEVWNADVAVLLGPGINMKRSPLCGRNFEYFSEDPFLAGRLGAAYVSAAQGENVAVSLKHFAANNQETNRQTSNSQIDERALREIYLSAFEYVVKTARPATIMASYNRLNGYYACENRHLLTEILREEWGFDGVVISDWGACADLAKAVKAGMDLEMPDSHGIHARKLKAALKADGGIPAGVILSGAEQLSSKANQTAILEGAASHAAGVLKSYLNYLDVIVTLSPLMGLLGTVIGMIGSFNVLSVAEGQPFAITGGVAEALVCTASGLFVAIIALIAYTYLSQQVSNFVSQMEKLGSLYLAIVEADQK